MSFCEFLSFSCKKANGVVSNRDLKFENYMDTSIYQNNTSRVRLEITENKNDVNFPMKLVFSFNITYLNFMGYDFSSFHGQKNRYYSH